jgi:nucleoporin NUP82
LPTGFINFLTKYEVMFVKHNNISYGFFFLIVLMSKVLQTPAITYRIISLQLNGNGRLLSVAGERDLTAVILPRSGLRSTRLAHDADEGEHMEEISCRTLTVGRYYHGRHPTNQILKALWHPLSESKTHIVVLASDSILRMYDLSQDLEEPEQSFDISPATTRFVHKSTKKFSYSAEDIADDREDAVSFCFGDADEATNGWEAFSIFYVLRNGHIYVLCPVLPYKSVARRKHIEVLAGLVSVKLQHAQKLAREAQGSSNYAQIDLYRKQGIWVREALTSAHSHSTPSTLDSISDVNLRFMDQEFVTIIHQNQSNLGDIYRQGPFIVAPQSQVHEDVDASDIAFLNTDPVGVIVVTYKNGQVDELMQVERTEPAWSLSSTAFMVIY